MICFLMVGQPFCCACIIIIVGKIAGAALSCFHVTKTSHRVEAQVEAEVSSSEDASLKGVHLPSLSPLW